MYVSFLSYYMFAALSLCTESLSWRIRIRMLTQSRPRRSPTNSNYLEEPEGSDDDTDEDEDFSLSQPSTFTAKPTPSTMMTSHPRTPLTPGPEGLSRLEALQRRYAWRHAWIVEELLEYYTEQVR